MNMRMLGSVFLLFVTTFLHGCGSAPENTHNKQVTATMKGVALASGQTINGLSVTLELPPGVTFNTAQLVGIPASDPNNPTTGSSFIVANVAPSQTRPGGTTLTLGAIIASGFGPNQAITIDCSIAIGKFPTVADFLLTDFIAKDQDGTVIAGLWPTTDYVFY